MYEAGTTAPFNLRTEHHPCMQHIVRGAAVHLAILLQTHASAHRSHSDRAWSTRHIGSLQLCARSHCKPASPPNQNPAPCSQLTPSRRVDTRRRTSRRYAPARSFSFPKQHPIVPFYNTPGPCSFGCGSRLLRQSTHRPRGRRPEGSLKSTHGCRAPHSGGAARDTMEHARYACPSLATGDATLPLRPANDRKRSKPGINPVSFASSFVCIDATKKDGAGWGHFKP